MKTIYFVRHGESEGNVGPLRQGAETPLTETGRLQAVQVADRCAKLPIETIICSTMKRAEETAAIILEKNPKPIEYSGLFIERLRPSVVTGKPKDNPDSVEAEKQIRKNFIQPGWRHSDEENFDDLKARALEALDYLASRKEDNLLVVTHGLFLRIMVACVIFGKDLTARECEKFIISLSMRNTGICVLEHDNERRNQWGLWVWNDHAHLG